MSLLLRRPGLTLKKRVRLWTPMDLGPFQYYESRDINGNGSVLTDNTPVASWKDKGSYNNTLTTTDSTTQPIYKTNVLNGNPGVLFDGTNDFLTGSGVNYNSYTGVTIYVIYSQIVLKNTRPFDAGQLGFAPTTGFRLRGYAIKSTTLTPAVGTPIANEFQFFALTYENSSSTDKRITVYDLMGTATSTQTNAQTLSTSTFITRMGLGSGNVYMNGYMLHSSVYTRVHTAEERAKVAQYFKDQYLSNNTFKSNFEGTF